MADNQPECILAGIDTLELGICVDAYRMTEDDWMLFANAKEQARSTPYNNDLGSVTFNGNKFMVNRAGAQRYAYVLSNDDITLRINEKPQAGRYFPEVKVIFRSPYLWRNGWQKAVENTLAWVDGWIQYNRIMISRCDLTADFNVPLPILDSELSQLVTRAVNKRNYMKNDLQYGRFTSGKRASGYVAGGKILHCRIYDKVLEISKSNKKWLFELWAERGWQKSDPVTRVEFQCRRGYLRDMQTETVQDLVFQMGDLWKYLTEEWLTIREIGQDSHRDRWEMTEFWNLVQKARDRFGLLTGITRMKQQRPTYQKISRQLRGHLVSLYALVMGSMNSSNIKIVDRQITKLLEHFTKDPDFQHDVTRRIAKYRGMDN